jgi:hypothetical protein
MKGKPFLVTVPVMLSLLLAIPFGAPGAAQVTGQAGAPQSPQGPYSYAFTYQGQLKGPGGPVNGTCDLRFILWDAAVGGSPLGNTLTWEGVEIEDGLFTARLDFGGMDIHTGAARWLEVDVRCPTGVGDYVPLEPRQELTGAPAALSLALPFYAEANVGGPLASFVNTSGDGEAALFSSLGGVALWAESPASDGLHVATAGQDGVRVVSAGGRGLAVDTAAGDGVFVNTAHNNGVRVNSADYNGVQVDAAGGDGLEVGSAGVDGVEVGSAARYGVKVDSAVSHGVVVGSAGDDGVYVGDAGGDGVFLYAAGADGVHVSAAGDDGLHVYQAGSASAIVHSSHHDGVEVGGAQGYGLYVGRADLDGVHVNSTGSHGLRVANAAADGVHVDTVGGYGLSVGETGLDGVYVAGTTWHGLNVASAGVNGLYVANAGNDGLAVVDAGDDGVQVTRAGNPSSWYADPAHNGFAVNGAQGNGLYVGTADLDGIYVQLAQGHGVHVNEAVENGIQVDHAIGTGLHVNTAINDGLYVDMAWADGVDVEGFNYAGYFHGNINVTGDCYGCALAVFGLNAGDLPLEPGQIVAIEGVQAATLDNAPALWRVVPAGEGSAAVGVVRGRAELDEAPAGATLREGESGRRLVPRDGAAQPGEYLSIVIYGPVQVRVSAADGPVGPGTRLAVGGSGAARVLKTVVVEGLTLAESAPTIGIALAAPDEDGLVWVLVNPQ